MPTLRYTLLACALASPLACIPELELDVPENLPQRVHFRTATESFNAHWYLALRDGRIWVKGNEEPGNRDADWELLGATGLHRLALGLGNDLVRRAVAARVA